MRQGLLPIHVQTVPDGAGVTARAGAVLVYETLLAFGLRQLVRENVHVQKRRGDHDDFDKIADLVMMLSMGGDCFDDIRMLQADEGLHQLIGRSPAAAETLRQFLYAFHNESLVAVAKADADAKKREAYIVGENAPLLGLGRVNEEFVEEWRSD